MTFAGRKVELTATEYDLLRVLSQNAGRVLTYEALLRQVWGKRGADNPAPVRTYVKKLRDKLGETRPAPHTSSPSAASDTACPNRRVATVDGGRAARSLVVHGSTRHAPGFGTYGYPRSARGERTSR